MEREKIIEIALEEGFADAAIIDTSSIVFDASFRTYCEENLCGKYGANYSCPPDCGTPEMMKQKIQKYKYALVLRTVWDIDDFNNDILIKDAKQKHNDYMFNVIKKLKPLGYDGLMVGASGCTICNPCKLVDRKPCLYPQKQYSCISAYCIYAKDLANKCGMVYDYRKDALPLFGIYVFN